MITRTGHELVQDFEDQDMLRLYFNQISGNKLLSPDEERQLAEEMLLIKNKMMEIEEKGRDQELPPDLKLSYREKEKAFLALKNRLVEANLRLVVSIVKKYRNRGLSFLDLIGEGNLGLITAVERYDHRKGCRFSSYGTFWIRQAVLKGLSDRGTAVRVPVHMQTLARRCYLAAQHLTQESRREAKAEEIARYLNWPEQKVKEVLQISQDTLSLDGVSSEDGFTAFTSNLHDEKGTGPDEETFESWMSSNMEEVFQALTQREAKILQSRFGLRGGKCLTLQETGDLLGITRERVRQLQNALLVKLRNVRIFKEWKESF